ncbi:MAG TPA: GNAT family N-acetyltransferase [Bryobacteraceae bacterium]|jgi:GNAT superfamily N-acetyltransferase
MSQAPREITIVPARESDIALILEFVRKLAEYEQLSTEVIANEDTLRESLFGARPVAEVAFAFWASEPVGFVVFFPNFSTFMGRPGLYLEDLFVLPEFRGKGVGKGLLCHLARLAKQRNYARVEWAVLDWNQPAIDFYRRLGAGPMHDWTVFRLTGAALDNLADTPAHGQS